MERRRIHCPAELARAPEPTLTGEEAHYLLRVLRLKPQDEVVLFCGDGRDYTHRLVEAGRDTARLALVGSHVVNTDPAQPLVLLAALLKSGGLDEVIRDATALGITSLLAYVGQRGQGRVAKGQVERWRRIAVSAAQQCGRTTIPEIEVPAGRLSQALARVPADVGARFLFWEDARARGLSCADAVLGGVALVIGPEGGLTQEEADAATALGFLPRGLGSRVLRATLAPAVALAQVQLIQCSRGDGGGEQAAGSNQNAS